MRWLLGPGQVPATAHDSLGLRLAAKLGFAPGVRMLLEQ